MLSPCHGTESLPHDMWGEITSYLSYHDKWALSTTCKHQQGVLHYRQDGTKRQFEELPKDSALFKAYENLPQHLKTPKILLRLTEKTELICSFLSMDDQLHPLIEFFSAKGVWKAIKLKIKGLAFGRHGYDKDPDAARDLIEEQITNGLWQAVKMKIIGLQLNLYGYTQDLYAAKNLTEEQITNGLWQAMELKIKGLEWGRYGYDEDLDTARDLIEEQISKGVWQPMPIKIEVLLEGIYGYAQDREATKRLIFRFLNYPI